MHWICTVTGMGKPCGSQKIPGCESWKTLVSVTAYHSFAGEVEASNTPTIRRLTLSRHRLRPQLLPASTRLRGGLKAARTKLE